MGHVILTMHPHPTEDLLLLVTAKSEKRTVLDYYLNYWLCGVFVCTKSKAVIIYNILCFLL